MATGIEQRMTAIRSLRTRVLLSVAALATLACGGASRSASPRLEPAPPRQAGSGVAWYRVDDLLHSVNGQVLTADSLAPLQHVQVGLLDTNERVVGSAVTSGDGAFMVRASSAGEYHLIVRRIGYAAVVAQVIVTDSSGVRAVAVMAPDSVRVMFADERGEAGDP